MSICGDTEGGTFLGSYQAGTEIRLIRQAKTVTGVGVIMWWACAPSSLDHLRGRVLET
jgi:hypothetical protein